MGIEVELLENAQEVRIAEAQRFVKGKGSRVKMVDINSKDIMASVEVERMKSYGRGGAGNIRSCHLQIL